MTFTACVAAGIDSSDAFALVSNAEAGADRVTVRRHDDLLVAWPTKSPWIQTHEEGDGLVVLDGTLHNLSCSTGNHAKAIFERYRAKGAEVARGLLGDFVFIVLDRGKRTLLVSRDPVGVRPWYQATAGDRHVGVSDLASLVALPWVDTEIHEVTAIEYLAAIEESRGETLYQGIQTLRPGQTWYRIAGRAGTFSHHQWDLEPELDISWEDAAERCRVVFEDAVRSRLSEEERAASELSGGLDSSTVVGTIVQLGRNDVIAGRMLFDGPRADERFYSDAVIRHWGIEHISARPWIPNEAEVHELTTSLRRPCPDANFIMFATLYRMQRESGLRAALTGLGGDDAFAASRTGSRVVSAVKLRQGDQLVQLLRHTVREPRRSWSEFLRPTLGYIAEPWRGYRRLPTWVRKDAAERADLRSVISRRPERITGLDAIDERVGGFTSGYNASILETRAAISDWIGRRESHPFLDPRFVRATYGLNPWWPTRGRHDRALHIGAFGDRLPRVVAERLTKAEFSEVVWPQVLDDDHLAMVRAGPLATCGWLDQTGFDAVVVNARRGMANAAIPLFRCLSLDRWIRSQ